MGLCACLHSKIEVICRTPTREIMIVSFQFRADNMLTNCFAFLACRSRSSAASSPPFRQEPRQNDGLENGPFETRLATGAMPVGLPALILSIMISAEARRKLVELLRVMRCGG